MSLLQDEFPDVTISKIRFLESQGLVDPERTPSGYRKFYDDDIERLRWVLRQQRDAFLPLKVIKGRLEEGESPNPDEGADNGEARGQLAARASLAGSPSGTGASREARTTGQLFDAGPPYSAYGSRSSGRLLDNDAAVARAGVVSPGPGSLSVRAVSVAPGRDLGTPLGKATQPARPRGRGGRTGGEPGNVVEGEASHAGGGRAQSARPPGGGRPSGGPPISGAPPIGGGRSAGIGGPSEELALEELVLLTGVDVGTIHDMERFGLITPRVVAGASFYDEDAATIARLAAAFARHGVEARHLRAYKGAAEREAGLVQQVVMPLLRQRNPEARAAAHDAVEELSALGGELRTVLLRAALSELR